MTVQEALMVTFEAVNDKKSDLAIAQIVTDLAGYPADDVLTALSRCRKELRRITLSDILDRIPGGHPGPEQAWALCSQAMHDETRSLIWSDEMREAYAAASAVDDDPVAARMAFKEVYMKAVAQSRDAQTPITWTLSRGTDTALLELVVSEGVKAGQLTPAYAQRLLPQHNLTELQALQLTESVAPRLLT